MVTERECRRILSKYAKDGKALQAVWVHSKKVQEVAVRLAEGVAVDLVFVRAACLVHDVGRLVTGPGKQGIRHGVIGAEIVRKEGFAERFARVCETHVGAGISKKDIVEQQLPLPMRDFLPETREEKIICTADSLVFGKKEGTIAMVVERYTREVNAGVGKRAEMLYREVKSWKK